jgi:NTP pyrophosphatase (non-canonical NTP hydrolase)
MQVYEKALYKWGRNAQIIKAIEEMSELTKELAKLINKQGDLGHIAEEIADTKIMIEQLEMILNIKGMVEKYRQEKIDRLERLVNE